jgi:conjugative relaxase-like TrwC/TraI family protein
MLEISKLSPGQVNYYLGAARAPGTPANFDPAAYYVGGHEAPGRWWGNGLAELGLTEGTELDPAHLSALLENRHPTDPEGGELVRNQKRPGFDLTFSAPKSVSVLWALDDTNAELYELAQEAAVAAAMSYLEETAARVRRGKGGLQRFQADGFIAATFGHRTSRGGAGEFPDPQLHTHVVIANLAKGPDGRLSALDAGDLWQQARTAGFIYQAVLRQEVTRLLAERDVAISWTDPKNGQADVAGVPTELNELFSTRSRQLREHVLKEGHDLGSAKARSAAAKETREAKEGGGTTAELQADWAATAHELGWTREQLIAAVGTATREQSQLELPTDAELLAEATAHASHLERRRLIRTMAERGVDVTTLSDRANSILTREDVTALGTLTHTPAANGEVTPVKKQALYTTVAIKEAEAAVLDRVAQGRNVGRPLPPASRSGDELPALEECVNKVLAERPTMSEEQAQMVRHITGPHRYALVIGQAGTGKTYSLNAAHEAWTAAGFTVIGCATAGKAAKELEKGSGIPSGTIHSLVADIKGTGPRSSSRSTGLPKGCVLVVDEAGMAGTDDLAVLTDAVEKAGGRMVMVGDPKQLSPVVAGGLFAQLEEDVPEVITRLTVNRRQHQEWEVQALADLRHQDDRSAEAIMRYVENDRVVVTDTDAKTKAAMLEDYFTHIKSGKTALMMAHRREDVEALNAAALAQADLDGKLGAPIQFQGRKDVRVAGKKLGSLKTDDVATWRVGQRVMATRNSKKLGVRNGELGIVEGLIQKPTSYEVQLEHPITGHIHTEVRKERPEVGSKMYARHGKLLTGTAAMKLTVKAVAEHTHEQLLQIRTPDNERIQLSSDYAAKNLTTGYAVTVHKAQGATVDHGLLYGQSAIDSELAYVALSRGKASNKIFLSAGPEPYRIEDRNARMEKVHNQLQTMVQRSGAQTSATGVERTKLSEELTDVVAERRRLAAVVATAPLTVSELRAQATAAYKQDVEKAKAAGPQNAHLWTDHLAARRAAVEELAPGNPKTTEVQDRYRQWLTDNAEAIGRWDFLDTHSRRLAAAKAAAQMSNPPEWAPPVPDNPLKRGEWSEKLQAATLYRERWNARPQLAADDQAAPAAADRPPITQENGILGPRPTRRGPQQREWDQAATVLWPELAEAREVEHDGPERERTLQR